MDLYHSWSEIKSFTYFPKYSSFSVRTLYLLMHMVHGILSWETGIYISLPILQYLARQEKYVLWAFTLSKHIIYSGNGIDPWFRILSLCKKTSLCPKLPHLSLFLFLLPFKLVKAKDFAHCEVGFSVLSSRKIQML